MAVSVEETLRRQVNAIASTVQQEEQRLKAVEAELESKAAQLEEERATFEAEKQMIAAANKVTESKVKLDVGGTIYHVSRTTLTSTPGSMLEAMFSGRHELKEDKDGCVFIDQDGAAFKLVLEYLRSPTSFSLEGLTKREVAFCEAEFDYFGLPSPSGLPSPVPLAPPLSLRMNTNQGGQTRVQLQGDETCCTISHHGVNWGWAVGSEVLADDAVWKTHVKQPGQLVMGVIVNPTPSAWAYADATFAGWGGSSDEFFAHSSSPGSPGWPGWQHNDEAIFKLNAAACSLTLHLKRTGQRFTFSDLPAGKGGQWRFCISMPYSAMVVLSCPTDDEFVLVQ